MGWAYLNQLGIEGFLSLWRPAFFCTLGPVPKPAMTVVQPENGLRGWKEITAQLVDLGLDPHTPNQPHLRGGRWPRACHPHDPRELVATRLTPATPSARPQPWDSTQSIPGVFSVTLDQPKGPPLCTLPSLT